MAKKAAPEPPTDAQLERQLGSAWPAYRALREATTDLRPEWKWYGEKYGWSLKLFKGSRNLCFLNHYAGEFMAAFLFGERDVPRVLGAGLSPAHREEFSTARQYAEGRPLRVRVRGAEDLPVVLELLEIKRSPIRPPRS